MHVKVGIGNNTSKGNADTSPLAIAAGEDLLHIHSDARRRVKQALDEKLKLFETNY